MANITRLLIKNGTLIDGSGGDPVPNRLLVVDGNRITRVGETDGSTAPETPNDRVIDATGKFILPGLGHGGDRRQYEPQCLARRPRR